MDKGLVLKKSFFITTSHGDVRDEYNFIRKLGHGSNGSVYLGINQVTGQERAIKQVLKSRIKHSERFSLEISIIKNTDHPNIVKLYEVFEDNYYIYLVMEYCSGGELFDYLIENKQLSEREAAHLFHQILNLVNYLHSHDIVHRDLKPEALLFAKNTRQNDDLKLCNFGLAKILNGSEGFHTRVGTCFYIAPEVLDGTGCGKSCDLWSCGVILYIMLCGYPPFYDRTDAGVMDKVQNGIYDFEGSEWDYVSEQAKDLIRNLLILNPYQRYTVEEALTHPWITSDSIPPDRPLSIKIENLRDYVESNRLKKSILMCIASQCSDADLRGLNDAFSKLDTNGDGSLTIEELERGINTIPGISANISEIMRGLDVDKSGTIDYSEFLAATIDRSIYMQEDRLYSVFKTFDVDGSGKISGWELSRILGKEISNFNSNFWDEIIREADINCDGEIDFNEFIELMSQRRLSSLRF